MRILLFLVLFGITIFKSAAQNYLELKNKQTAKTRHLKIGSKLYYKSIYDSSFVKAKIAQIKDTSIVFYCPEFDDEETPVLDIPIRNIKEIKKATSLHAVGKTVGSVLLPVGGFLFFNGLFSLSRDNEFQGNNTYDEDLTKSLTVTGGVFLIGGAIPFLIKPKVYNLKDEWELTTKKGNGNN